MITVEINAKTTKKSLILHNRKMVFFQKQIETALKRFKADLDLRIRQKFTPLPGCET